MKFRLRAGRHVQNVKIDGKIVGRKFTAGEIVEYHRDLAKRWPEKYERVDDSLPASLGVEPIGHHDIDEMTATATADYEHLNFKDLQAFAAAEAIDLKGAKTREEALKAIKEALK